MIFKGKGCLIRQEDGQVDRIWNLHGEHELTIIPVIVENPDGNRVNREDGTDEFGINDRIIDLSEMDDADVQQLSSNAAFVRAEKAQTGEWNFHQCDKNDRTKEVPCPFQERLLAYRAKRKR